MAETTPRDKCDPAHEAQRQAPRRNGEPMTSRKKSRAICAVAVLVLGAGTAAVAQVPPDGAADADAAIVADADDLADVGKVGKLHDELRRAQQRESLYRRISGVYTDYAKWKARVEAEHDLTFAVESSLLQQWGVPNGGSPALQVYVTPSFDWTLFRSATWGTGSLQFEYDATPHYPTRQDAADVQNKLGLVTPINDVARRSFTFAQLTYTHAGPGNTWLVTAGQYPLWNFDGNAFLGNQQQNFNNYILSQNGSSTYRSAGWGAYAQYNASASLQLAGGVQATNNLSGETLTTRGAADYCCTWFGYAQWTPTFGGVGAAQYSLSYFDTPGVPAQPASRNWSVNAVQHLPGRWAMFGRANGAQGYTSAIRASYALGVARDDPLARAPPDQIALAVGYSDTAPPPAHPANARDEKVVEAYWTWTFFGGVLVTPSVQVIVDPALDPARRAATVLSLRATLLF